MPELMGAYRQVALVDSYVDSAGNTQVFDSVQLTPTFGCIYYQTLDLGYPAVRQAKQDNAQADGVFDQTAFFSDRSVAIGLKVLNNAFGENPDLYNWDRTIQWNSANWWIRYLSGWVTASRRVSLYLTDDTGASFWMPLVGSQAPSPVVRESAWFRDILLTFTNPTGKLFGFNTGSDATPDGRVKTRIRQSTVQIPGRTYPHGFDFLYPPVPGATTVDYQGSVPNGFLVRIYTLGTIMTGPSVTTTAPDGSTHTMALDASLEIPANTIVEFDTNAKTVKSYPVSSPDVVSDRDGYKVGPLTWPQLRPGFKLGQPPGRNQVLFGMESGDTNAYCEIIYHNAYLL